MPVCLLLCAPFNLNQSCGQASMKYGYLDKTKIPEISGLSVLWDVHSNFVIFWQFKEGKIATLKSR